MKTQAKLFIAIFLLLAGAGDAIAKKVYNAGENGVSFRIGNMEQARDIVSISPEATSKAGTVELQVNSDSRIWVPGVMMNVIEYKAVANGGRKVNFKWKNTAKGIYYLTVASADANWLSTMTLQ